MDPFPTFITKEALALTDADLTPNGKLRSSEKAKANHLLRQLQLRLQYARLKVDHGWQKQRLNEVENLYFRQQKQSDSVSPVKPTYPTTALLSTPIDPQLLAQSQPEDIGPNSSLSFKLPAPAPNALEAPDGVSADPIAAAPTSYEHTNGSGQWLMDAPTYAAPDAGPSTQTHAPPRPHHDPNLWTHNATHADDLVAATAPIPLESSSAALASFTIEQSQSPSFSRTQPTPSAPSSLTYDSFWSSHNAGPLPDVTMDGHWQTGGPVLAAGFAPAPMFTPRNGKGKGKGRVAGGSVMKQKSPVSLPG
ncbi:hypothetical protein MVEN_00215700 [Mycena venus]|uniref:Uncharacterized protein n=1 Tax=Mycena venus TaxID=2733690 RepID=A0A8H6YXH5_9AGAR|nr:hypothetical protein MVEN_00215700 [Mycena venus]